ncbi:MAG: hypothetical protein PARBA_01528 [Parabacteroides sp.]
MDNNKITTLKEEELVNINGGGAIEIGALILGYICWAAQFCYDLGKD